MAVFVNGKRKVYSEYNVCLCASPLSRWRWWRRRFKDTVPPRRRTHTAEHKHISGGQEGTVVSIGLVRPAVSTTFGSLQTLIGGLVDGKLPRGVSPCAG